MHRDEIVGFLDEYLESSKIDDPAENGLQVEGRQEVCHVALGVSASCELFRRAARRGADMVLVHHGLLWKGATGRICGSFGRRVGALLQKEMSLVAYHLPLDLHPEVGNNAQIARRLCLENVAPFGLYRGRLIGVAGELPEAVPTDRFFSTVEEVFNVKPHVCATGPRLVKRISVVSGGAAFEVHEAIEKRMDAYLTGTIDEYVPEACREGRIHYVALGHYNTERFGVQALGRLLRKRFGLKVSFIEIPNPY